MLAEGFALLAAALNAAASVLQRRAARDEPDEREFSLRLLLDLVRRPAWFAGIGCVVVGFGAQAPQSQPAEQREEHDHDNTFRSRRARRGQLDRRPDAGPRAGPATARPRGARHSQRRAGRDGTPQYPCGRAVGRSGHVRCGGRGHVGDDRAPRARPVPAPVAASAAAAGVWTAGAVALARAGVAELRRAGPLFPSDGARSCGGRSKPPERRNRPLSRRSGSPRRACRWSSPVGPGSTARRSSSP